MSELPKYLERLEDALFDIPEDAEAMTVSEVDGYLAGLLLIGQDIPLEEWLPRVWRRDPGTPDYLFQDKALLDEISELVEKHRRMLARDLHKGDYAPIFDVDTRNDDIIWEFWMSGFDRAMAMRSDAFVGIEAADEDVRMAHQCLHFLALLAEAPAGEVSDRQEGEADLLADLPEQDREALIGDAPDLIPPLVQMLYDWTRPLRPAPDFAIPVRRAGIGRNDPCPCGSGRKYKKCCGAQ